MSTGKKLLSVFLALAVLVVALPIARINSFASDPSDFTYQVISETDKTAEIIGYSGSGGDVTIPSVIDGYTITSIGDTAFGEDVNDNIESVLFPSTVEYISSMSVAMLMICSEYSVDDSNACYSSNDGVLFNKDKTELIRYPAANGAESYSVPDSVQTIGLAAFAFSGLKNIVIPDGVETITDLAFTYAMSLKSIEIPNSVTYLGGDAFSSCLSLEWVILSDSLTSINSYAFYGCEKLSTVVIPQSISDIDDDAFIRTSIISVFGTPGSYAETFANGNNSEFIDIDYLNYPGDMNKDKMCNESDLNDMILISVNEIEPSFLQTRLGDINGDGVVDGFDIAELDRNINSNTGS